MIWTLDGPALQEVLGQVSKSWAAARKFLIIHIQNNAIGFLVSPTWQDSLRYQIPALEQACEDFGLTLIQKLASAKEPPSLYVAGIPYPIYVMSGDKPERIAGFSAGHCWIDEGARMKMNSIPQRDMITQVRGRLRSGLNLYGIVSTTPEGRRPNCWVYQNFVATPKEGYRIYYGKTDLNKFNHCEYIKNLKKEYTARELEQYVEGKFISLLTGRAHHEFNRDKHVKRIDLPSGQQVFMGCDFNVDKMSWVIGYEVKSGYIHIFDEIVVDRDARVDTTAHLVHAKGWGRFGHVKVCVDKSSKNRSIVGESASIVLQKTLRGLNWNISCDDTGANPPVIDRIMKVNRMLLNAEGQINLTIDPKCSALIEAFENIPLKGDGYDKSLGLDHPADGTGYLCVEYKDEAISGGMNF